MWDKFTGKKYSTVVVAIESVKKKSSRPVRDDKQHATSVSFQLVFLFRLWESKKKNFQTDVEKNNPND